MVRSTSAGSDEYVSSPGSHRRHGTNLRCRGQTTGPSGSIPSDSGSHPTRPTVRPFRRPGEAGADRTTIPLRFLR